MTKLRAGVIGLGMGRSHAADYYKNPDVELVAIADRIESKRNQGKIDFNVPKVYTEGIELIKNEKLDIISVAVPNDQHKALTIAALESGAHVLCEKPMALNAQEAEEMMAVAERVNRKLGINFSYRFFPQSQAMKDMVDKGFLGDIYYARSVWFRRRGIPGMQSGFNTDGASGSWFFDKKQAGGGPLIDLGVHRLDLALWLMGYPEPEWVLGSTYNIFGSDLAKKHNQKYTVEDLACSMIKFKNGATLELTASWAANIKENEKMSTRVLGSKGGLLHYNLDEGYNFDIEFYNEQNGRQMDTKLHPPVPAVMSSYNSFVDAVKNDKPFGVSPKEGVIVMKILDAIYESAAKNEPIKF